MKTKTTLYSLAGLMTLAIVILIVISINSQKSKDKNAKMEVFLSSLDETSNAANAMYLLIDKQVSSKSDDGVFQAKSVENFGRNVVKPPRFFEQYTQLLPEYAEDIKALEKDHLQLFRSFTSLVESSIVEKNQPDNQKYAKSKSRFVKDLNTVNENISLLQAGLEISIVNQNRSFIIYSSLIAIFILMCLFLLFFTIYRPVTSVVSKSIEENRRLIIGYQNAKKENKAISEKYETTKVRAEKREVLLIENTRKMADLSAEIGLLKKRAEQLESEKAQVKESYEQKKSEKQQLASELASSKATLADYQEKNRLLHASKVELTEKIDEHIDTLTKKENQLNAAQITLVDLQQQVQSSESAGTELRSKVEMLKKEIYDISERLNQSKIKLADKETEILKERQALADISEHIQELTHRLEATTLQKSHMAAQIQELEDATRSLKQSMMNKDEEIAQLQTENSLLRNENTDLIGRINAKETELKAALEASAYNETVLGQEQERIQELSLEVKRLQQLEEAAGGVGFAEDLISRMDYVLQWGTEGIWDIDNKSGNFYASPRMRSILGVSQSDDLSLEDFKSCIIPDDSVLFESKLDAIFLGKINDFDLSVQIKNAENVITWLSLRVTSLKDKNGDRSKIIGSALDITSYKSTEETLRNLSLVAEKTDNAVIVTDRDGRIEWVNKGFEIITEYTLGEVKGQKPGTFLQGSGTNPSDVQKIREGIQSKRPFQHEILNYSKTGRPYWLLLSITPILDSSGNVEKYIAIERDITELKEKESKLFNLSLVASKTDNAVIITDKYGLIDWVNEGFTHLTEYTLDEVKGQKPGSFLQGKNTDPVHVKQLREGLDSLRPFKMEILNYSKSGREYFLAISITPIFDSKGNLDKYIAIESDVTERKILEQEIANSEEQLRKMMEEQFANAEELMEKEQQLKMALDESQQLQKEFKFLSLVASHTDNSVIITDKFGKIEWVNSAFEKISGYTLEEVKSKKPGSFLQGDKTNPSDIQVLRSGIENKQPFKHEIYNYHKSGDGYWVGITINPIKGPNGEVEKYIAVQTDITAQKQKEQELKHLNYIAKKSSNGVLVANDEGKIEWLNDRFELLTGYGINDLKGRKVASYFELSEAKEQEIIELRQALAARRNYKCTIKNFNKNGETLVLSVNISPIYDDANQFEKSIVLLTDVSAEQRIKQDLEDAELRLAELLDQNSDSTHQVNDLKKQLDQTMKQVEMRNHELGIMIDNAPIGICVTTPEGIFEQVNDSYCQIYGFTKDELIGQHFTKVVKASDYDFWRRKHDMFIQGKDETRGEFSVLNKWGDELHILADSARVNGVDGRPRKITYVVDLTERKKLEQETKDAESQLRVLMEEQYANAEKLIAAEKQLSEALDSAKLRSHELDVMIHNAPIGICVTNPEGLFEQVNDAYCKIYGYKREDLIGSHFTKVVKTGEFEFWKRKHDMFISGKDETRGEFTVLDYSGGELHILADSARVMGSDNRPRKITYVVDMTERKKLEQETKDSEQQLRMLMEEQLVNTEKLMEAEKQLSGALDAAKQRSHELDIMIHNAPIGICVTNPEGLFEQVNDSYCQIYNYKREELIGQHFTKVVKTTEDEFWRRKHDQFIQGKDETRGEFTVIGRLGNELHILADSARVMGADNRPRKITYVVDMTERKKLEQETKDSEQQLRILMEEQLVNTEKLMEAEKQLNGALGAAKQRSHELDIMIHNAPIGICVTNKMGKFVQVNDSYCQIYGYSREELIGQSFTKVVKSNQIEFWERKHKMFIEGADETRGEFVVLDKEGNELNILADSARVHDQNGEPRKITYVVDLTDRKRMETEIKETEEMMRQIMDEQFANAEKLMQQEEELSKALALSENLSLVASKTDNAVIITDVEGKILYVNAGFERITEYRSEEVLGKKPGSFLQGPDTNPDHVKAIRAGLASKKPFEQEIYNYSKTGRPYWLLISMTPVFDAEGNVEKFIAIETEITKRKKEEDILTNLSLVASKTDNAVVITNAIGEIEYVNDGFEKITGYKAKEVLGNKPGSFLQGPDTDPQHVKAIREGLNSKKPFTQEILNYSKTGKPYWLSISMTPVFDKNGDIEKFIAIETDITERKSEEEVLKNLSLVASKTDNAVIITDKNGLIEWVNDGFENITEYKFEEVVGKKPGSFLQGKDTTQDQILNIREGLKEGKPFTSEIYNYSKSGRGYWLALSITPIYSQEGELEKFIAIESDITERKLLEEEIAASEQQMREIMDQQFEASEKLLEKESELKKTLEIANRKQKELEEASMRLKETQTQMVQNEKMASIGQLTAGIAHEINNPINFVYNGIDSLKMSLDDLMVIIEKYNELSEAKPNQIAAIIAEIEQLKKKYRYQRLMKNLPVVLDDIKNGANRTIEIVKGLRVFSRLDEEEQKMANINECLESTLILLRNKTKDKVRVRKYMDEHLVDIMCYPGQLNQVFMNLLSNAIQAIPEERNDGEIQLYTENLKESVIIRIMDNGSGIPEDVKKRIFEPFFTTKPVGIGTGLGLSISYGIIEKHDGKIYVNSEVGKGTEFVIELPKESVKNLKTV